MSSPFSTFEEFSNAEGPIYTFANNSVMISILLILSLIISVYFFYASFGMRQELTAHIDVKAISLLLIAGLTTLTGFLFNPQVSQKTEAVQARSSRLEQNSPKSWTPLALLGFTGVGGAALKRSKRSSRKYRSVKRSR
ncbi:MAG: hypothetical protein HY785_28600 [Oscillatoriophycideae cyanobacterium NC_groundwater_1537_Pr4_S-0.65um_50_18]|nr:hypothetical protein [Oscillatoriophycideae cyanobacterium NC_groundwater_1537_Pr4_S-0.65um_50_18]